jgi:hypothetical protein
MLTGHEELNNEITEEQARKDYEFSRERFVEAISKTNTDVEVEAMLREYDNALDEYVSAFQMFNYAKEYAFIDTSILLMEAACIKIHAWKKYYDTTISTQDISTQDIANQIDVLRDHRGVNTPFKWLLNRIGGNR